jgi:hypothetical protein
MRQRVGEGGKTRELREGRGKKKKKKRDKETRQRPNGQGQRPNKSDQALSHAVPFGKKVENEKRESHHPMTEDDPHTQGTADDNSSRQCKQYTTTNSR